MVLDKLTVLALIRPGLSYYKRVIASFCHASYSWLLVVHWQLFEPYPRQRHIDCYLARARPAILASAATINSDVSDRHG